jgi:hypothetical protein
MKEGRYPDVEDVELGITISECWHGQFKSAGAVAQSIHGRFSFYIP